MWTAEGARLLRLWVLIPTKYLFANEIARGEFSYVYANRHVNAMIVYTVKTGILGYLIFTKGLIVTCT